MMQSKGRLAFISILALIMAALWAVPAPASAQGASIGVVNLQRALKECKQGKRAMVELQRKAKRLEVELKGLQKKADKLGKELENTAMLLKPEARRGKQREFDRLVRRIQDRQRDARAEMQDAERDALAPILRNMQKVIQQIGQGGKYGLIVEAKSAYYYPQSADLTLRVVAAYDKAHP